MNANDFVEVIKDCAKQMQRINEEQKHWVDLINESEGKELEMYMVHYLQSQREFAAVTATYAQAARGLSALIRSLPRDGSLKQPAPSVGVMRNDLPLVFTSAN